MTPSSDNEKWTPQPKNPSLPNNGVGRQNYIDFIRTSYSRISERQQHSGVTRWALLGGLAYLAWQSIPMLVKIRGIDTGWNSLYLVSALLLVISSFGFHLYQSLTVNRRSSPYDFRQLGATASAGLPLYLLVILVSFGPTTLFTLLAWKNVPNLPDLTYRFLSLVAWMFAIFGVILAIFVLYTYKYTQSNGFMPPAFLASTGAGNTARLVVAGFHLSFIAAAGYFLVTSIDIVPPEILEQVLLLGGSIAIVPPCIETILSGLHKESGLELLSTLERDILMHDLPVEEIRARLESDLIGSELGDWAKRRVEKVRSVHNEIAKFREEVDETLEQVLALDKSLKYERQGRLMQCSTRLEGLIDELNSCREPLNKWLTGCKNQPFRDPYINKVIKETLVDFSALMQSAVDAAQGSLAKLRSCLKEIDSESLEK